MPSDRRDSDSRGDRSGHGRKRSRSPLRHHHRESREDDRYSRSNRDRIHERDHKSLNHSTRDDSKRSKRSSEQEGRTHRSSRDVRHSSKDDRRSSKRDKGTPSEDEDLLDLDALGISAISEEDYYVKSAEFKYWLQDARDRDFTEMNSEQTHRYFRKFVRRWNDGALPEKYYRAPPRSPMTSTSRWGTTLPNTGVDDDDRSPSPGPRLEPSRPSTRQPIGPSMPASDRQLALESQRESEALARKYDRASTRRKALDRAEEIAPKLGGKEGKMAEKRATNSANKEMRDKEVGGLELDESTLMGEGTSFQAALKARDAAAARKKDRRDAQMADARSANEDRLAERRQKENDTMKMLHDMARQRFG